MFLLLSFAPDGPAGDAGSKLLERDLLFGGILLAEQRARCGERAGAVARLVHNAAFGFFVFLCQNLFLLLCLVHLRLWGRGQLRLAEHPAKPFGKVA